MTDDHYTDIDDESSDLVPCPECGAEIYDDAEMCPHCGNFVVHDARLWSGRPTWWIVLGFLGVVAVILALALGF